MSPYKNISTSNAFWEIFVTPNSNFNKNRTLFNIPFNLAHLLSEKRLGDTYASNQLDTIKREK